VPGSNLAGHDGNEYAIKPLKFSFDPVGLVDGHNENMVSFAVRISVSLFKYPAAVTSSAGAGEYSTGRSKRIWPAASATYVWVNVPVVEDPESRTVAPTVLARNDAEQRADCKVWLRRRRWTWPASQGSEAPDPNATPQGSHAFLMSK
jgi:hypothetical protein